MPSRNRLVRWLVLLPLTTLVLTACGGEAEVLDVADTKVLIDGDADGGMDALLPGRVAEVEGCLGVTDESGQSYAVVWPHDTEVLEDDPLTIALPDEGEYRIGDEISLAGGVSPQPVVEDIDVAEKCPGAVVWLAH